MPMLKHSRPAISWQPNLVPSESTEQTLLVWGPGTRPAQGTGALNQEDQRETWPFRCEEALLPLKGKWGVEFRKGRAGRCTGAGRHPRLSVLTTLQHSVTVRALPGPAGGDGVLR